MTAREFHIGDILSAMTGTLVSPYRMDGVYAILDHMSGENLMTHQLPRVSREAEPYLREQFPDLAAIEMPDFSQAADAEMAVAEFLDAAIAAHGETRMVEPMPTEAHTSINPIAELKMMRPDMPIIVVGDEEPSNE